MTIRIHDKVKIKPGATKWMKERGYWGDYISYASIDDMVGTVTFDYTHLGGDDSHFSVDLGLSYDVGVSEEFLKKVK